MPPMSDGILVLHNLPSQEAGFSTSCAASDQGVMHAVQNVVDALKRLGMPHRVAGVRRLEDLPFVFSSGDESVVFNLVERLDGGVHQSNQTPAVCRAFGRACTGGSVECLVLTLDKALTKARLAAHGLHVPPGLVVPVGFTTDVHLLPSGPLFIKPLCSDGSEGIGLESLANDRQSLLNAVARIHREFGQPALVEKFIEGRELNLAVFERDGVPVPLPPAEIDFSLFPKERPHIVDYAIKWNPGTIAGQVSPRRIPAPVDAATAIRLQHLAQSAWTACGCSDYARIDTRMDASGTVYILEVNVNCDLSPLAGLPAALAAANLPFDLFVKQVVDNARKRMSSQ